MGRKILTTLGIRAEEEPELNAVSYKQLCLYVITHNDIADKANEKLSPKRQRAAKTSEILGVYLHVLGKLFFFKNFVN